MVFRNQNQKLHANTKSKFKFNESVLFLTRAIFRFYLALTLYRCFSLFQLRSLSNVLTHFISVFVYGPFLYIDIYLSATLLLCNGNSEELNSSLCRNFNFEIPSMFGDARSLRLSNCLDIIFSLLFVAVCVFFFRFLSFFTGQCAQVEHKSHNWTFNTAQYCNSLSYVRWLLVMVCCK